MWNSAPPPQPYYQQNVYGAPPAPAVVSAPQTTIINAGGMGGGGGTMCPVCNRSTGNISRKAAGLKTWLWCICLWFFTGICCFIPWCTDSCKDT